MPRVESGLVEVIRKAKNKDLVSEQIATEIVELMENSTTDTNLNTNKGQYTKKL